MKIKLKTLSPIHIGSGETISILDYFIDGKKFCRIDVEGLFNDKDFLPKKEIFIEKASKKREKIQNILDISLLRKYVLYSLPLDQSIEAEIKRHNLEVKTFIKSAGRVFIPGSSLKGSILSGIIWNETKNKKLQNIPLKNLQDEILSEISKKPNDAKAYSRWISITDSNFKKVGDSLELALVKIERAKGRRSILILCEVLKKGIEFEMEIKEDYCKIMLEEIFKATHNFYKKIYEKEEKSFPKPILPEIPKSGFLGRIGMGVSVLSTSYLVLAEDLNIKNYEVKRPRIKGRQIPPLITGMKPTTKKLISGKISLGWVEIKNE